MTAWTPARRAEQAALQSARMQAAWARPESRAKLLPTALDNLREINAAKPPAKRTRGTRGVDNRSARMKALWAIPEEAARMRANLLKASQKAQEARGGPVPADPQYIKVRALLGAKVARQAFAAIP